MDELWAEASIRSTPTVDGEKANGQSPSNDHSAPKTDASNDVQEVDSEEPQPEAETSSPSPPPPPTRDPKLCGVCHAQPGKYKCPRCQMP